MNFNSFNAHQVYVAVTTVAVNTSVYTSRTSRGNASVSLDINQKETFAKPVKIS